MSPTATTPNPELPSQTPCHRINARMKSISPFPPPSTGIPAAARWLVLGMLLTLTMARLAADDLAWLEPYNVAWTSPSKNSSESMPCGGGDTGMNVWVENGDLLCYVQRSGCFDENNQYLKLGRLRVRLDPNPFVADASFRQELKLRQGSVEINGKSGNLAVKVDVWADVFRPVVHVDVNSSEPVSVTAAYESWRQNDLDLPNTPARPRFACLGWDGYPGKVTRFRDEVEFLGNTVSFLHRNRDDKLLFDYAVRQQGLEQVKDRLVNTQKGRTFGGILRGTGLVADGTTEGTYTITPFKAWNLKSAAPAKTHRLELVSHIAQTDTLAQWQQGLKAAIADATPPDEARRKSIEWWEGFWRRSHIVIDPAHPDSKLWQIGRNYQLFRYQLGCNAFGDYPTKFNGGNFTFDPSLVQKSSTNDPDWRAWGGGSFTAQNQRLVHWPMLKSGDADCVRPQLEYYRRALPSAEARVKAYYGHDGALFAEQLENFGLPISAGWGWPEPDAKTRQRGKEVPFADPRIDGTHGPNSIVEKGEQANAFVSYHYESQLEYSYLALEGYRFFGGDLRPYLPLIRASVRFFDEHYQLRQKLRSGKPLDANGKLVIFPSTSCESYRGARNPADLIAGLQACLESLLALDDSLVPAPEKQYYRELLRRVPPYTYGEMNGERVILPAESYARYQNCECPQFYPLFPFNRFTLERDDMTLFRTTWKHGKFPKNMVISWHQDGIFYARMGMVKEAADYNQKKLENSPRRFPTFWGPGHDWAPDHNWGGTGMIGLQEMLMQTPGDKILLLPAWPKDWDVDFKLHAPGQTVVEGTLRNGKLTHLKVTPEARRKDLIVTP
jgi:hypothetical protein